MEEKRKFRRVRHAEPVRYQFPDPNQIGHCLSKDISEGGIRIRLTNFTPVNTELILKVRLDDENVAHCTGGVVSPF